MLQCSQLDGNQAPATVHSPATAKGHDVFGTYARNVLAANGRYNPASNEELTPGPAAPVYKNGPRIRAVKIPLDGWVVQIWVEALLRWHTMSGSPVADNPDTVIAWGLEQVSGYPTA